MKAYTVMNHGLELKFNGDLLAHSTSRRDDESRKWTEFFIYFTDKESFVVDVVSTYKDGRKFNRSFVCKNLFEVQKSLCHPHYGTMSFTAQKAYERARNAALDNGIIDEGYEIEKYPLGIDAVRIPPSQEYNHPADDFDFTDEE